MIKLNILLILLSLKLVKMQNRWLTTTTSENQYTNNNISSNTDTTILSLPGISETRPDNPEDVKIILQDILNGKTPLTIQNESYILNETKYDQFLRPTGVAGKNKNIDKDGTLIITIILTLRQLVSLDEKNQILTTSFYMFLKWGDPRLMWNSTKYKNITSIIAPSSKFWLPDLAIMNSALTSNFIVYPSNQNIIIFSNGDSYLTLSLPSQATRCKLDVYKYPFDAQKCSIIIGSWLNTVNEITFMKPNNTINITRNYLENSIWKLESIQESFNFDTNRFELANKEYYNIIEDSIFGLKSNDMVFVLNLKRQPLYIMINGIFPCFVLNCVILLAFGVPFVQQINLC
jgi:nicotinic acetylcholine receptor beta-4